MAVAEFRDATRTQKASWELFATAPYLLMFVSRMYEEFAMSNAEHQIQCFCSLCGVRDSWSVENLFSISNSGPIATDRMVRACRIGDSETRLQEDELKDDLYQMGLGWRMNKQQICKYKLNSTRESTRRFVNRHKEASHGMEREERATEACPYDTPLPSNPT